MTPIIKTEQLSKKYKDFYAVKDVSLQVEKGDIYGFIGLNGAGKTTVIKMLLNMIRPTSGNVYIKGEKVSLTHYTIWNDVGYIVERPVAYPELTVMENLFIYQKLRHIPDSHAIARVLHDLNLMKYAKTKAKNLSLGNFGRLGLAKALLHEPDILILDEPMNGLDPSGIVEVRHLLKDLAENKGVTILMSSHLLTEVAKVATKIGMIHHGQLIKEIETAQLNQLLKRRLIVNTTNNEKARSILSQHYDVMMNENDEIEIKSYHAINHPESISKRLADHHVPPTKLIIDEENLESFFLRVVQEKGVIKE